MQTKGKTLQFEGEDTKLKRKYWKKEFKLTWKQVKECFKKGIEEKRLEQCSKKEMQSKIYKKQDKKCNICLKQKNIKKNINHYISDITDDLNQCSEENQGTYCKKSV